MSDWPVESTALVVTVPAAEPVIGRWRGDLDPSAPSGMPPHVTVLYPWLDADALHEDELDALREIVAGIPAFDVEFTEFQRFPRTLWLAPHPADPFVRMTLAVQRRWPERDPYAGRFPSIVPHLSVGDAVDPDALGHVVADVAPRLPFPAHVGDVTVMVRDTSGMWTAHSSYPLGAV